MGDRGCRAFEENTVAEIVLPAGLDSPGVGGGGGGVRMIFFRLFSGVILFVCLSLFRSFTYIRVNLFVCLSVLFLCTCPFM